MKILLWTIGDANGIGVEIILKAFSQVDSSMDRIVVVGSYDVINYHKKLLGFSTPIQKIQLSTNTRKELEEQTRESHILYVLDVGIACDVELGKITRESGMLAMTSIEKAATLCEKKTADAMITAPIHKQSFRLVQDKFQGHTDYLESLFANTKSQMLFYDYLSKMKVLLATIHIPLRSVSEKIIHFNFSLFVEEFIENLHHTFCLSTPRIAVLGLNPHASDGGGIGSEENDYLTPQIINLQKDHAVTGPFAADAFFGSKEYLKYDATVALYHDQGLIAFKLIAFDTGVNVTLGLPIIRTSPDHGTGFDIAGKNLANPSSFICAHHTAKEIITYQT